VNLRANLTSARDMGRIAQKARLKFPGEMILNLPSPSRNLQYAVTNSVPQLTWHFDFGPTTASSFFICIYYRKAGKSHLCAASRSRRACFAPLALADKLDSSMAVCSACAYRQGPYARGKNDPQLENASRMIKSRTTNRNAFPIFL